MNKRIIRFTIIVIIASIVAGCHKPKDSLEITHKTYNYNQIVVCFDVSVSQKQAENILYSCNMPIIERIPDSRNYIVEVPVSDVDNYVAILNQLPEVEKACQAELFYSQEEFEHMHFEYYEEDDICDGPCPTYGENEEKTREVDKRQNSNHTGGVGNSTRGVSDSGNNSSSYNNSGYNASKSQQQQGIANKAVEETNNVNNEEPGFIDKLVMIIFAILCLWIVKSILF